MEHTEKSISKAEESGRSRSSSGEDSYYMRCGQIGVRVEFSDSPRSLDDCLWNVLCRSDERI